MMMMFFCPHGSCHDRAGLHSKTHFFWVLQCFHLRCASAPPNLLVFRYVEVYFPIELLVDIFALFARLGDLLPK